MKKHLSFSLFLSLTLIFISIKSYSQTSWNINSVVEKICVDTNNNIYVAANDNHLYKIDYTINRGVTDIADLSSYTPNAGAIDGMAYDSAGQAIFVAISNYNSQPALILKIDLAN